MDNESIVDVWYGGAEVTCPHGCQIKFDTGPGDRIQVFMNGELVSSFSVIKDSTIRMGFAQREVPFISEEDFNPR